MFKGICRLEENGDFMQIFMNSVKKDEDKVTP